MQYAQRLCDLLHLYVYIYVAKYHSFGVFQSINSLKALMALSIHTVNVMVNCRFTLGRALFTFFLLVLVLPRGCRVWGSDIRHVIRCSYVCMPYPIIMHNIYSSMRLLKQDSAQAVHNATNCSAVLLHIQYSESTCSVHTGCVFFGTLVIALNGHMLENGG